MVSGIKVPSETRLNIMGRIVSATYSRMPRSKFNARLYCCCVKFSIFEVTELYDLWNNIVELIKTIIPTKINNFNFMLFIFHLKIKSCNDFMKRGVAYQLEKRVLPQP